MNAIQNLLDCRTPAQCLKTLVMFLISLLINVLIIRFLWNTALVKHITILRPVDSLLNTFLLAVGIAIFKL